MILLTKKQELELSLFIDYLIECKKNKCHPKLYSADLKILSDIKRQIITKKENIS